MNPRSLFPVLALLALAPAASAQIDIEYSRAAGESLKLDAKIPDGPGPFPAVILVHGGGWSGGDKSGGKSTQQPGPNFMVPIQETLTRAGFAWFTINYRLAPRFPLPAGVEDLETAIRWVKQNAAAYRVDPRRIAMSGESAGGHMVALAAMRADESTRLAAVVAFYGNHNLVPVGVERGAALSERHAQRFGVKVYDEAAEKLLRSLSPVAMTRPGLPPFLLVHGTEDKAVPFQLSLDLQDAIVKTGGQCDLLAIPGGVHGMIYWEKDHPGYKEQVAAWLVKALAVGGR